MAESVDALVSNTNVSNDVPVRPRLWVHKGALTMPQQVKTSITYDGWGIDVYFFDFEEGETTYNGEVAGLSMESC